jgi:hypothetical protein
MNTSNAIPHGPILDKRQRHPTVLARWGSILGPRSGGYSYIRT